jgi:DNA-binding NtrC family response regulator
MTDKAQILVIMPPGLRRSELMAALKVLDTNPIEAADCREARRLLANRRRLNLVISDVDFRDGDWRDNLALTQERPDGVAFLVSTPLADEELWSEALWRGAYDVLAEPYSTMELCRIVEGALRSSSGSGAKALRAIGRMAQAV